MAHTDPDMTRAYQRGHARRVLRVEMVLPYRVPQPDNAVRETRAVYAVTASPRPQEKFPENFLTEKRAPAQVPEFQGILERETRLELATPTLARLCSTN